MDDVAFIMIGIVVVIEWFVAAQFILNLEFWHEQLPGMCMDGRLKNESLANISFSIDDTFSDDNGEVNMKCKVPVHIYPCPDTTAGFCRDFESEIPLPTARVSEFDTGLKCVMESTLSYTGVCRHRDFTCATGPCTAYEKTGRLCASNMISPTRYECYYIPSTEISVRAEHTSFPIWWLLLLLVITLPAVLAVYSMGKMIMDMWHRVGLKGLLVEMGAVCVVLCGSIICIVVFIVVFNMYHKNHAKGEQTVGMTQFDLEVGPDGQVVLPDEEPIQEPSAWVTILVISAFVCIPALIGGLWCAAVSWCESRSAVAVVSEEEEDEDGEEDSDLPTDKLLES